MEAGAAIEDGHSSCHSCHCSHPLHFFTPWPKPMGRELPSSSLARRVEAKTVISGWEKWWWTPSGWRPDQTYLFSYLAPCSACRAGAGDEHVFLQVPCCKKLSAVTVFCVGHCHFKQGMFRGCPPSQAPPHHPLLAYSDIQCRNCQLYKAASWFEMGSWKSGWAILMLYLRVTLSPI